MSNPVEELLKTKGINYTPSGKDFLTKCLNPDHLDSNPSFRIDRSTGVSHCFSCGYKLNIFKHFGVLTNSVSIRIIKLKEKLQSLVESVEGLEPLKGAKPFTGSYRGISSSTLKKFGAFTTDAILPMADRICFPLTDIRDKTTAFIGRSTLSDQAQRYQNYPEGANIPLFPSKVEGFKTLVLVEGLFDFLNCYDKGMHNVVACFGTEKLNNDTAKKLQAYKVMGIEKIFIMFDGDTAGRRATEKLKPLIEEADFVVDVVNLPDGLDPGDLDQSYINTIKAYTQ